MYKAAKTATSKNGGKIVVGTWIRYIRFKKVRVVGIHKQGADGTILTTDPAPNPNYPHHFSCRASDVEVVQ